jgi:hypothetical protein
MPSPFTEILCMQHCSTKILETEQFALVPFQDISSRPHKDGNSKWDNSSEKN